MSIRVCLNGNTIGYPEGGGHFWVYLNWALGFKQAGAEVIWMEPIHLRKSQDDIDKQAAMLRRRLAQFGLDQEPVLCRINGSKEEPIEGHPSLSAAADADLLFNLEYGLNPVALKRFRRTALLDIDPGMTQTWISRGEVKVSPHDHYFTIGETVGQPGSRIPDTGMNWRYTPPAIALAEWPVVQSEPDAPFTAISQWRAGEWMADEKGEWYQTDKRTAYEPYFDLPRLTRQPIELAICIDDKEPDHPDLLRRGWRIRRSEEVSNSPEAYRQYIQQSRGEFGCAKPAYVKLQTAWISDRTLCYLASGKPAVVQNTGPSRFLPDREGILRFNNPTEAAACLNEAAANYDRHAQAARAVAEELFDAAKVAKMVLETCL